MRISAQAGDEQLEITIGRVNGRFVVTVNGVEHLVDARKLEGDFYSLIVDGRSYEVSVEADGSDYRVRHGAAEQVVALADPGRRARELRRDDAGTANVLSVMPGKVVRLLVAEGDQVEEHQGLLVVEAMKMENEIGAPKAGRVTSIGVQAGRAVEAGETLITIE